MESMGRVCWVEHPRSAASPHGHRADEGSGALIGFVHDEHGQLCGVVEMDDGRFRPVRLSELRRFRDGDGRTNDA